MKRSSGRSRAAGYGIVLVTCSSVEEGENLAKGLVLERLAACVNLIKGIDSFFWWEGHLDHAQEVLLVIKTVRSKFAALEKYVKAHHSYQVPEVIFLPIAAGHGPYLKWLKDTVERG